ncbi:MAG: CehA/McbA family metallohydrolase [Planctomycetes bacterium]|nr:CehA/McbA family metallohydrolase [Planctomycetota bacterium]
MSMIHTYVTYVPLFLISVSIFGTPVANADEPQFIEPDLVHLRSRPELEWSSFPEAAPTRLTVTFSASKTTRESCLLLRQQDVKQSWAVTVNDKKIGELYRDENDMVIGLAIPADTLKDGDNVLAIEATTSRNPADDIRVGSLRLFRQPLQEVLSAATLNVTVTGTASEPIPCRITILDAHGSLITLGTVSNEELAIRPGTVYSSTGRATVKLPAGQYTVIAGRGFEYSIAEASFTVKSGETHRQSLAIRREVATPGYVACDTHVHTLTHSGHGDATIVERMITLAGEGIELPIATDHNVYVDYDPIARQVGVRRYFTPVIGNEVTTPRGHFNIFPVQAGAHVPDSKQTDWGLLFDDIQRTPGVKIAILNHARDLHSNIRPFGPILYNSIVGENLDGWPMRFNAMEVVNSGATQTDVLQLFHDWMGLLNRGRPVTPVGSSDSHDVARHFVGQGRTYIRCDDRDPGNLDVDAAVNNFLQGRVMVSYGLLAELTVNEKYSSGELAPTPDSEVHVAVRVLGPHWVQADRVMLFANGALIREEKISARDPQKLPDGVKWSGTWKIPRPRHDVHLVAIAMGPGVERISWRTAKPYQPTSTDDRTHVIGCSGAVWLDVDQDGRPTSARDYAERMFDSKQFDIGALVNRLAEYDAAVAAHSAHLLRVSGVSLTDERLQAALKSAPESTQTGFRQYQDAWRENEIARTKP